MNRVVTSARLPAPPRRRWGRLVLGLGLPGLLLGLFAGYWLLAPAYVEGRVVRRLEAALARRGLALESHRLAWDHWTRLTLSELRVKSATGTGVAIQVDRVDVTLSGHHLLRGEARAASVAVGTVTAEVDLDQPLAGTPAAPESAAPRAPPPRAPPPRRRPRSASAAPGSTTAGGALDAATLTVERLVARVRRGARPRGLRGVGGPPGPPGGGRDAARRPGQLRGRTVAVEVEGVLTPARVDVRIRPADASPVFVHAVPDQGALSAREAVLRRDASGLSLGVGTIELHLGPADAPA
ncbi:MAG: hypothetical protein R3F60_12565 [bacterium]